jgi:hypothetical protein
MCEKKSEISERVSDLKSYETRQLNDDVTMHWKILEDSKEIEVVVKVNEKGDLLITVNHRILNRGRFLDSILCQSWTFEYRTIPKPDKNVRLLA